MLSEVLCGSLAITLALRSVFFEARHGAWDLVRVSDAFVVDILGSEILDQGGVARAKARPETPYRPR